MNLLVFCCFWLLLNNQGDCSSPRLLNCSNLQIPGQEASTFLWQIDGQPSSYLFGTLHVAYLDVWPHVAQPVKEAFQQADGVFLELDLTNAQVMDALNRCQFLPDNETIADHLPRALVDRLRNYITSQKPSAWSDKGSTVSSRYMFQQNTRNWTKRRPFWLWFMIKSLSQQGLANGDVPFLDLYLTHQAKNMQKITGSVERVQDQCEPLNELEKGKIIEIITRTLDTPPDSHEEVRSLRELIHQYNCGNEQLLVNSEAASSRMISTQESIDRQLYDEMIVQRNRKMTQQIIEKMQQNSGKSLFFAVGAGHLIGSKNETIVSLLRQSGFSVKRVRHSSSEATSVSASLAKQTQNQPDAYYAAHDPDKTIVQHQTVVDDEMAESRPPKFSPKLVLFQDYWIPIREFPSLPNKAKREEKPKTIVPKSQKYRGSINNAAGLTTSRRISNNFVQIILFLITIYCSLMCILITHYPSMS